MKIAILADATGEKALYLYDFFKEGNRVTVECLLTRISDSPLADTFRKDGIDVISITPDKSAEEIAEVIKQREVELIVLDDFPGEFPERLKEASELPLVAISSKEKGPLEIIEANKKILAAYSPKPEASEKQEDTKEKSEDSQSSGDFTDQEQEWAKALDIDLNAQAQESENQANKPTPPTPPQQTAPDQQTQYSQTYQQPQSQQPLQTNQQQGQQEREPMPPNYLAWSIVITILCCLLPGIVAIIYSASVSSKYYAGNIEGAKKASRNAQIWCIISVVLGIVWSTLYMPLSLFLG